MSAIALIIFSVARIGVRLRRWSVLALACGTLAAAADPVAAPKAATGLTIVRFGFSRGMFRGVNENDARASLKAYSAVIARDRDIAAHPDPLLFDGTREMVVALQQGAVDVVAGLAEEVIAIPDSLVTGPYLIALNGTEVGTDYVLLVRQDGPIARVADLRGRRVAVLDSVQGSLAGRWLEVLLGTGGLGAPRDFFGELRLVAKPSLAVLPVFFRQFDACVITRQGFAVMGEMNPQVPQQLRVVAVSPRVVPAITCFRRGFDDATRLKVAGSVNLIEKDPTGRQLLTIFQSERIEARGDADLASTRQLLADHARLTAITRAP